MQMHTCIFFTLHKQNWYSRWKNN